MIIPRFLAYILFRNKYERRAALARYFARRKTAMALRLPHADRWVAHGLRTLGGGTTHRRSTGSGGYNGRTGNPPTGNRRPGMRRTKGSEI